MKASSHGPYALFISSYMMPKMKGDDILKNAKKIAPDTQRLLMADASEIDTLVNAVNEAQIHSCITLPFSDEDLINHVQHCVAQYDENLKLKNLKRITARQNKQLFQIAKNFKKKSDQYSRQIKTREKEIRVLASRIKSAGGSLKEDKNIGLKDILTKRSIPIAPDSLGSQFLIIKDQLKQIIEAAGSHKVTLKHMSYDDAFNATLSSQGYDSLVKNVLSSSYILIE